MNLAAQQQFSQSNFHYLNILRVHACFLIVSIHAFSISQQIYKELGDVPLVFFSAIDVFFVMSGFLMIHIGRNLYGTKNGMKLFALKRFIKTPIPYWIYTIVFALIFIFIGGNTYGSEHVTIKTLISSLLFFPTVEDSIIPLGWTLNMEVFFYALFFLSLFFKYSKGPLILITTLILLVLLGHFITFDLWAFNFWTDPIILNFVWGIGIAMLYYAGFRISDKARLGLFLLSFVPIFLVSVPFEYGDITRPFTFGLGAAMLVMAATLRNEEIQHSNFSNRLVEIGNGTYSIYLSHVLFLKAIQLIFSKLDLSNLINPYFYILISVIFTTLGGYLLYRTTELPLYNYLRVKILKKSTSSKTHS